MSIQVKLGNVNHLMDELEVFVKGMRKNKNLFYFTIITLRLRSL